MSRELVAFYFKMAKKFQKMEDLLKEVKKDLVDRIYPDLLTRLSKGTKEYLEADLAVRAKQISDTAPRLTEELSPMPPPGNAAIQTEFLVSPDGSRDGSIKTPNQAEQYNDVFKVMFNEKLGTKNKLLELLSNTGLT